MPSYYVPYSPLALPLTLTCAPVDLQAPLAGMELSGQYLWQPTVARAPPPPPPGHHVLRLVEPLPHHHHHHLCNLLVVNH